MYLTSSLQSLIIATTVACGASCALAASSDSETQEPKAQISPSPEDSQYQSLLGEYEGKFVQVFEVNHRCGPSIINALMRITHSNLNYKIDRQECEDDYARIEGWQKHIEQANSEYDQAYAALEKFCSEHPAYALPAKKDLDDW